MNTQAVAYHESNAYIKEIPALRKIEIGVGERIFHVCITELYMLHRRLAAVNIEQYFYNLSAEYDTFTFSLPKHKSAQELSIPELVKLKNVVCEMVYLYELDAILKKNNIIYTTQEDLIETTAALSGM